MTTLPKGVPTRVLNHIETGMQDVVMEVQLYLDCERNDYAHLMLVVMPACRNYIANLVYSDEYMDSFLPWLRQRVDGESPFYTTPRASGNKNLDAVATWMAHQIIENR